LLGEEIADTGTYLQGVRPGGMLYGEGNALWITNEGESAHFAGLGVGRPTGSFPAGHFAVSSSVPTASEKLARLSGVAIVCEFDVDQDGNYH